MKHMRLLNLLRTMKKVNFIFFFKKVSLCNYFLLSESSQLVYDGSTKMNPESAVVVAPSAPAVVVARSAPPAVERGKGLLLLSNINALSNIVFFRCRSQKNR